MHKGLQSTKAPRTCITHIRPPPTHPNPTSPSLPLSPLTSVSAAITLWASTCWHKSSIALSCSPSNFRSFCAAFLPVAVSRARAKFSWSFRIWLSRSLFSLAETASRSSATPRAIFSCRSCAWRAAICSSCSASSCEAMCSVSVCA
jgi:hypothetical protein